MIICAEKWLKAIIDYYHLPLSAVILQQIAMLKVTAGFMWAPPKSPSDQPMAMTTNPMPRAVCTDPPTLPLSQLRGRAHCTDTKKNVARVSERTSRQKLLLVASSFIRRTYAPMSIIWLLVRVGSRFGPGWVLVGSELVSRLVRCGSRYVYRGDEKHS